MAHPLLAFPCMCACLRTATRAVTRRYTDRLADAGVGAAQFTLLMLLRQAGPQRQTDLADFISADSTTLTRTLAVVERQGWVSQAVGTDRRVRIWSITPKGTQKLESALPLWESAQSSLKAKLAPDEWNTLRALLAKVAA